VRYTAVELYDAQGRATGLIAPGDTLVVRASYRAERPVKRPSFQLALVDVDTGVVVTTASTTSRDVPETVVGEGTLECRFDKLPLRPRQYVLRLSVTDEFQLASYDVVTAGPRFAVTGHGAGVDSLADEQDGLVSLPYVFAHRVEVTSRG
jgi:hypothetical protein